jgi:hypothetical protein
MSKGIFRAIHGAAWLIVSAIALSGCGGITQSTTPEEFKKILSESPNGSIDTYAVHKPFGTVMRNLKTTAPECLYNNFPGYMGGTPPNIQTADVVDLGPGRGRLEWRTYGHLGLVAEISASGGGTAIEVHRSGMLGDVSKRINLWANGDRDCHKF